MSVDYCARAVRFCFCCTRNRDDEFARNRDDEHARNRDGEYARLDDVEAAAGLASAVDIECGCDSGEPTASPQPNAQGEGSGGDAVHRDFLRAVARIKELPARPPAGAPSVSNSTRLRLYALYKQATEPDLPPEPSRLQVVARAKWEAWHSVRHLPPSTAERLYVEAVAELLPDSEAGGGQHAQHVGKKVR